MTPKPLEKFVISQKGLIFRQGLALIIQESAHPGKWDVPGGRIDEGEDYSLALAREMEEEVGIKKFVNLGVADYLVNTKENIPFCGILNVLEDENEEIKLCHEHAQFKWIREEEIDDYKYVWSGHLPSMIRKGFALYKMKKEFNGRK